MVQQKQGRVKPTMQMKGNVNVHDDKGLEREADVMSTKVIQNSFSTERQNLNKSGEIENNVGQLTTIHRVVEPGLPIGKKVLWKGKVGTIIKEEPMEGIYLVEFTTDADPPLKFAPRVPYAELDMALENVAVSPRYNEEPKKKNQQAATSANFPLGMNLMGKRELYLVT